MSFFKKSNTDAQIRVSKTGRFFGSKNLLVYTPSSASGGFVILPVKSFDNARVFIEAKENHFLVRCSNLVENLACVDTRDEAEAIVCKVAQTISPRLSRRIFIALSMIAGLFIVLNLPVGMGASGSVSSYGLTDSQLVVPRSAGSSSPLSAPAVSPGQDMSDPFGLKIVPRDDNK